MTKTTDTRQLRLLVDGILSVYGIDNLELSIKLCKAFTDFYGSPEPKRTREEILAGLQKAVDAGQSKQEQLAAIKDEINRRVHIRPVGQDWQDFIAFAWKMQNDKQQTIGAFLDWWLADEWQKTHPPSKPYTWYVKWDLAFADIERKSIMSSAGEIHV